jgi:hypothetical protein
MFCVTEIFIFSGTIRDENGDGIFAQIASQKILRSMVRFPKVVNF